MVFFFRVVEAHHLFPYPCANTLPPPIRLFSSSLVAFALYKIVQVIFQVKEKVSSQLVESRQSVDKSFVSAKIGLLEQILVDFCFVFLNSFSINFESLLFLPRWDLLHSLSQTWYKWALTKSFFELFFRLVGSKFRFNHSQFSM